MNRIPIDPHDPPLSRKGVIILSAITAVILILLLTTHRGEAGDIPERISPPATYAPLPPECEYSDELPFELKEDSFDLPEGYTICIHIDQVLDAPTP